MFSGITSRHVIYNSGSILEIGGRGWVAYLCASDPPPLPSPWNCTFLFSSVLNSVVSLLKKIISLLLSFDLLHQNGHTKEKVKEISYVVW